MLSAYIYEILTRVGRRDGQIGVNSGRLADLDLNTGILFLCSVLSFPFILSTWASEGGWMVASFPLDLHDDSLKALAPLTMKKKIIIYTLWKKNIYKQPSRFSSSKGGNTYIIRDRQMSL